MNKRWKATGPTTYFKGTDTIQDGQARLRAVLNWQPAPFWSRMFGDNWRRLVFSNSGSRWEYATDKQVADEFLKQQCAR